MNKEIHVTEVTDGADVVVLTPHLHAEEEIREAIGLLEIDGPALELPYVPAAWVTRAAFRHWWGQMQRHAQYAAARLNAAEGPERIRLHVEVWRVRKRVPRASDGAMGGYRIRRVVPWTPGRFAGRFRKTG